MCDCRLERRTRHQAVSRPVHLRAVYFGVAAGGDRTRGVAVAIGFEKRWLQLRVDRGVVRKPISNLRWWIGGLLFASTVINYIDRQTLSVLGPYLENTVPVEQPEIRSHSYRLSHRLFGRTNRRGPADRSHWNSQRSDDHRHLVFDRRDVNVARCWTTQLCDISFSARRG